MQVLDVSTVNSPSHDRHLLHDTCVWTFCNLTSFDSYIVSRWALFARANVFGDHCFSNSREQQRRNPSWTKTSFFTRRFTCTGLRFDTNIFFSLQFSLMKSRCFRRYAKLLCLSTFYSSRITILCLHVPGCYVSLTKETFARSKGLPMTIVLFFFFSFSLSFFF